MSFGFGFPNGFAVTVRRWRRDEFGDVTGVAEHTVALCGLLRHSSEASQQGRDQVVETATIAMPSAADITAADTVVLPNGTEWHVHGRPYVPHSPMTGWEPATAVPLRRVTG